MASCLADPFHVLVESKGEGVSFGFADAIIKLKHFHSLSALLLTLDSVFVESKLTVLHILF